MSTCRGCWNDGLGDLPDVVLCEPVSGFVMHRERVDCTLREPHGMNECGAFLPPRSEEQILAQAH